MPTLYDKITFDGKHYNELTDPAAKAEVDLLASKLRPLEHEILNSPLGIIMTGFGSTFTSYFEEELSGKIRDLIAGR